MRGSPVEFYEVETLTKLPAQLEVGAFYCIKDLGIIRINHGNGDIRDYGIGLAASGSLATNETPGLVRGDVNEGYQQVDPTGRMVMPLAQVGRRGGIRAAVQLPVEYTDGWKIGVDVFGNAYVSSRTAEEAAALSGSNLPSATNPFATSADVKAHEDSVDVALANEAMLRENADNTEREARRVMEAALTERIDSVIGKVLYLPSYNFGTNTPTKEQLDSYAKSFTGLTYVENGTSVKNEFDNAEWIYSEATNNGAWVNQGNSTVATASNTSLGLVMGDATTEGGVQVRVDGRMTFPKAATGKYGGVRVGQVTSITSPAAQRISIDATGIAYFPTLSANQLSAITSATGTPTASNPFVAKSTMDTAIANAELRWNA
jgi:hypothetical protein